jgi:hypothetical protein
MRGCVDSDYDLDTLDKEAIFYIPPVPVGALDTAFLTGEGVVVHPGIGPERFSLEYPVNGIFSEDIVDKFFFDGARTASLEGKIDIVIEELAQNTDIVARMYITDEEGNVIQGIEIADRPLDNANGQPFILTIEKEYMHLMKDARGVRIILDFTGSMFDYSQSDGYILLYDLVLKTGGMHIDF